MKMLDQSIQDTGWKGFAALMIVVVSVSASLLQIAMLIGGGVAVGVIVWAVLLIWAIFNLPYSTR